MGTIRLLLALSVIGAHCQTHPLLQLVGGEVAVQIFFVISGFYIALIIGSYKTKKNFWMSRWLRLYPLYLIFCIVSLFLDHDGLTAFLSDLSKLPRSAAWFLSFTNITMLFQDIAMFLGIKEHTLSFVKHYNESYPPLWQLLLNPYAWSLGSEISFYLIAPYLLKRSVKTISTVILISVLVRLGIAALSLPLDPWTNRFFPAELSTFLCGSLAYKLYNGTKEKFQNQLKLYFIYIVFLIFLFSFKFLPAEYQLKRILIIITFSCFIGHIFHLTKDSKIDRFIGMLSYPVYLSQSYVIYHLLPEFHFSGADGKLTTTLVIYASVTLFAILLCIFIEKPIDLLRSRLKA